MPLLARSAAALLVAVAVLLVGPAGAYAQVARPADAARWVAPLDGRLDVVRGFAPPAQRWLPGHRGVDLRAPAGAAVRSAGAGRVTYARAVGGVPVVSVTHADGMRTTYQPVRAVVRAGAIVRAGTALGRLDLAGGHCLPASCLHWGLLRGGTYLDPLALLTAGPPRLLPLAGPLARAAAGLSLAAVAPRSVLAAAAVPVGLAPSPEPSGVPLLARWMGM